MQRRSALILGGALGALGPGLVLSQSAGRESWDAQADVVVVGSGAAGLSAAITAADAGCSVLLAEKAYTAGDFKDVAYFDPFYLKDFVATVAKNKVL